MGVLNERGRVVAMTSKPPDDPAPATLSFASTEESKELTPYEFCNKHGLFVGPSWRAASTNVSTSRVLSETTSTTTTTTTTTTDAVSGAPSASMQDLLGTTLLPGGMLANLIVGNAPAPVSVRDLEFGAGLSQQR